MSPMPASTAVTERELSFGDGWAQSPTGLLVPPSAPAPCLRHGLPIAIGLFSGAGGMDLGVHQAGFHVVASSDSWSTAALTYLHNLGAHPVDLRFVDESDREAFEKDLRKSYGMKKGDDLPKQVSFVSGSGWLRSTRDHEIGSCAKHIDDPDGNREFCETFHSEPVHRHGCELYWLGDVRKLSGSDFLDPLGLKPGDVDLVCGGPPCQGFSHAGQRNIMDPRNSLVFEFTRLVAEIQPKAMIMENVVGMASMVTPDGINVVDALSIDLEARGYGVRDALSKALHASSGSGIAVKSRGQKERERRQRVEDDAPVEPEQLALLGAAA